MGRMYVLIRNKMRKEGILREKKNLVIRIRIKFILTQVHKSYKEKKILIKAIRKNNPLKNTPTFKHLNLSTSL